MTRSPSPATTTVNPKDSSTKKEDNRECPNEATAASKEESYSEYLNKQISKLSSAQDRYRSLEKLQKECVAVVKEEEAVLGILHKSPNKYIKFGADACGSSDSTAVSPSQQQQQQEEQCVHLPPFKWALFKRGYTIGLWLKVQAIHTNCTLYQFRQSKYGGIGICCTINPCSNAGTGSLKDTYQVTIYTLPFSHKRGQYIRSKIALLKNTWQFWCISHDNPYNHYIHRPKLHFSINGVMQFAAELVYPSTANNPSHAQQDGEDVIMEENILLGGASFQGSLSQVLLWKDSFTAAPDFLSGYIGEMGPNVVYQVLIPSIPINRDAMYHDYTNKKRRSEMGIGTPSVLHNAHTLMLAKTESKLHFRFIPSHSSNGLIILEDVILEGDLRGCPKLGVIQPFKDRVNTTAGSGVKNIAAVKLLPNKQTLTTLHRALNDFPHTFHCIGGLHSTLTPLFLALIKPPGVKFKLQAKLLQQHIHMKRLFDYNFFFEKVLAFLADCLQSSIYIREEAVQTGFCSQLAYLLNHLLLHTTDIIHPQLKDDFSASLEHGLLALFDACCGSSTTKSSLNATITRAWETSPSSSLYLRRTSDLALQFLHSFVFHLSLYKHYPTTLSKLLLSFVDKYKSMGDFIMKHVSIQYILDQIHLFSTTTTTGSTSTYPHRRTSKYGMEKESTHQFFHFLILSSLQHSDLSERDVTSTIINLTISPLGSVTSYVIFHTFFDIIESGDVDIMIKLGRFLILSEFHSVIGPVLLSRTVCLFAEEEQQQGITANTTLEHTKTDENYTYDWKNQWRTAFLLFVWLTSVSSLEGEVASHHFGNLLHKSAISGTLDNCIQKEEFIDILLPSNTNTIDRLKSLLPLLPGLFVLLKQDSELGWSCQLLSKISYFFQKFRSHLSTTKISKEYIPIFIMIFCIVHFQTNKSASKKEETTLIRETCEESILDILSYLIMICMRFGNELSFEVWKNVNASLHIILLETLTSDEQILKEYKKIVLTKICNTVLKALTSVDTTSSSNTNIGTDKKDARRKEPQMTWNVDFTQGISRFIILIEEKELYKKNPDSIPSILKILSTGREDLGWLQTVLQQHQQQHSKRHLDYISSESTLGHSEDKQQLQRESRGGIVRNTKNEKSTRALNVATPSSTLIAMPEESNSSKYLLPILQPCLHMILKSIEERDDQPKYENILMIELKLTLSAALVGLSFCHARDTGLQALASVRKALLSVEDDDLKSSYQELVLFATNELHARYQNERMVKYSNPESTGVPDEEIFESRSMDDDDIETPPKSKASLGWSQYAGLGSALDSACLTNLEDIKENDSDVNVDDFEDQALSQATENIFTLLESYLNKWDESLLQDEEECCSIPLYSEEDSLARSTSNDIYILSIFQESNNNVQGTGGKKNTVETSATASNTNGDISYIITHYIEIVSLERNRIDIVKSTIMEVILRETEKAVEYNFWKTYRENCLPGQDVEEWERCVLQDGGRDTYSRFITAPKAPEFERFLPEYLQNMKQPSKQNTLKAEEEFEVSHDLVGLLGMKIKDITKETSTPFGDSTNHSILDLPQISSASSTTSEEKETDTPMATEEETCSNASSHDVKNITDANPTLVDSEKDDNSDKITPLDYHTQPYPISPFSLSPDTPSVSSQTSTSTHSIFTTNIDDYYDNCLHVRPEGSRKGVLFLTSSYIMIEYESNLYEGEGSTIPCEGPNFCKWTIAELSHFYLRRYRLRDSAFELFFLPSGGSSSYATSSSAFFDFGTGNIGNQKRDTAANVILKRAPHLCTKQWPEKSQPFFAESLNKITLNWCCGNLSNFDYLMELNIIAGRSFNDLCQYPIFPWVLCNFTSDEIPDLNDISNFRDLTKPMGALNEDRLRDFIERYESFIDPNIPPFMYGSHYSTSAGVVLHFLVRLHPYANLHRQLQGGHFDVADRMFSSVERSYEMCTGASTSEVKELTPEWYSNPDFLRNSNQFFLGESQDGEILGDVVLPPWAKGNADKFVEVMRSALESKICTAMLPSWIDLIFGFKQTGPEAYKAHNVFYHLTYYGSIDVASIEDEGLRTATELQIAHFGQCPMQLFWRPHLSKLAQTSIRFKYSLDHVWKNHHKHFQVAKLSDWVHLPCPPPAGKNLIMVKICGSEKVVAVDENGIFHFFKWTWKPNEVDVEAEEYAEPDQGCFVAQRELPHFKSVPRLAYSSLEEGNSPVVAISQTMFASQTLLLVLSDGDGKGALALQFLDPNKNVIKGVAIIPSVHSSRIICIATDTMGSASHSSYYTGGGGGVGGTLAITGSEDGSATLWRFISSHYLPLRPRLRLRGHYGSAIISVSISSSLNICATLSNTRCCLFHLGNGQLLRSFPPSAGTSFGKMSCFSDDGFIILLCLVQDKAMITMFSLEGMLIGTKELAELPRKINVLQKNVLSVCTSAGVQFYSLSSIDPLQKIDDWCFASKGAYDIDVGPYPQQIIAAMASSSGSMLLHALPGITLFSEENRKMAMSAAVGHALAKPAQKIKSVVGNAMNRGTKFVKGTEENASGKSGANSISGIGGFLSAFRK